jgi:hypothetical protein
VTGGAATIVSTILPGEHGMQLPGGSTATKSISPALIDGSYSLSLIGDCPAGLAASVLANIPSTGDTKIAVTLSIDDSLDESGNAPDYTGATYVPLVGAITLPSDAMQASVSQVTLSPSTGATCTVDLVELTEASPCDD